MTFAVAVPPTDRLAHGAPPLVCELSPAPDPVAALRRFADLDGVLLLHSAAPRPRLGRYSFLTADPFRWFRVEKAEYGTDPLAPIAESLRPFACDPIPGLPPFRGGAAGLLAYELGAAWERLLPPRTDDLRIPALTVGVYDWALAWDHHQNRAWLISQGFPATDAAERRARAETRLSWAFDRVGDAKIEDRGSRIASEVHSHSSLLTPHSFTSTFTRDAYLRAVERVVEYIRAGDIFQANLSQRLSVPLTVSYSGRQEGATGGSSASANASRYPALADEPPVAPVRNAPSQLDRAATALDLYDRLCAVNPAPFAGYFAADDWAVLSASPERFLELRGDRVETRPIKGTRPRSADPAADERLRQELLASEKDRAENVMIVDLLRNDLSRVCRPGTVAVPELCSLETYETVHHLVSAVTGRLAPGKTAWDLLAAAFPGGSITGAPKVRAMEILRELEPTARGPYCGSLFYVGFDGSADSNILIRTLTLRDGAARLGVGGGITSASDPAAEYAETLDKAAGMLRALGVERL